MEISRLLTEDIHIEDERQSLRKKGLSWAQIEDYLSGEYRAKSQKKLFSCPCCHTPTQMVLVENGVCYFKHWEVEECAGDRNYKRYRKSTDKFQSHKHRSGVALIRNEIMSILPRFGGEVLPGYVFGRDLRYIPDLIIRWPDGAIWTLDYVNGVKSTEYQQYLCRKQSFYYENHFKSYFFFNFVDVTVNRKGNAIGLSESERGALRFQSEHRQWTSFIERKIAEFGPHVFFHDPGIIPAESKVRSIVYVDHELNGTLYRVIPLKNEDPLRPIEKDQWHLITQDMKYKLDRLFLYDPERHEFTWEQSMPPEIAFHDFQMVLEKNRQSIIKIEQEKQAIQEEEKPDLFLLYQRELERTHRKNSAADQSTTDEFEMVYEIGTYEWKMDAYKVMERMRNSSRIKSSPTFHDRIRECEEWFEEYEKTRSFRELEFIHTNIQNMKNALKHQ